MIEHCEVCEFFEHDVHDSLEGGYGWCARYPPVLDPSSTESPEDRFVLPIVPILFWCGEYKKLKDHT